MMKRQYQIRLAITTCVLFGSTHSKAQETHPDTIIADVVATQQAILASSATSSADDFIFLAFWDFDGTILKGDCSEGMQQGGQPVYKGLAQLAIESGYSSLYPPEGGIDLFWKDYRYMEHNVAEWIAYPFIPQIMRGASAADVRSLAERHFHEVLRHHYFASSVHMLEALEQHGIDCHIISASADIFVDAAAPTVGLPVGRFNGIELQIENGKLTEKIVYPVTWSDGKTEKLVAIVEEMRNDFPALGGGCAGCLWQQLRN